MSWIGKATLDEIRTRLAPRIAQGRQWLSAEREPLTWVALWTKLTTLKLPSTYARRFAVLGGIVVLLWLVLPWYAKGSKDEKHVVTYPNAALVNPILAGAGAILLIYAAIRQAQTASSRHEAQTKADLQRRITETFGKAVEQLGSANMEVRIGGIYTLERLAGEALASPAEPAIGPDLYWTLMETLTAFVRERARWTDPILDTAEVEPRSEVWQSGPRSEEQPRLELATDIAAVMAVICRRPEAGRKREAQRDWRFDLRGTDLRGVDLNNAHLEHATLSGAHLEHATLPRAHLEGADLNKVHLDGAFLIDAHLEGADLRRAHLDDAVFLVGAHLEGADLRRAHLEGEVLKGAYGDARTRLPAGYPRPVYWPRRSGPA